jgi:hypothetical protein
MPNSKNHQWSNESDQCSFSSIFLVTKNFHEILVLNCLKPQTPYVHYGKLKLSVFSWYLFPGIFTSIYEKKLIKYYPLVRQWSDGGFSIPFIQMCNVTMIDIPFNLGLILCCVFSTRFPVEMIYCSDHIQLQGILFNMDHVLHLKTFW